MNSSRLTSLFFPSALVLALPALAAAPFIDSVTADPALTTMTINGSNFAASPPRTVFLSGFATPLAVTSMTDTQIVASLPAGLPPGSYAVRVQGRGNGDFDEFFATFVASSSGGGACTSYSNAASSGTFAAQVTVLQGGSYALSAKLVVNVGPATSIHCSLNQIGPFVLVDDSFVTGSGEVPVILQGTVTTPGPVTYQASCTSIGGPALSYYNSKIQALCLQALVSPSP